MPSSFTSVGTLIGAIPPGETAGGAVVLTFPLVPAMSTGHYGIPKGSAGRNGQTIVAIVLHVLEETIETYMAYLNTALELSEVRPGDHGSIHYGIAAGGTIHQFVANSNTAWAVRALSQPTWTLLDDHIGVDVNYLTLNVGVERFISPGMPQVMFRALAELVAYLCWLYALPVDAAHIIDHSQLDDSYDGCSEALAPNLIASVHSLITQQTDEATIDTTIMASQLAALTTRVTTLETTYAASTATIATYAAHVGTIGSASVLGHVKESSTVDINSSTGVADIVRNAASYRIVDGTQTIVADIQAVVQFPTVISDTHPSSAPAWVTLGNNWKVTPPLVGLYRLRARVRFEAATWTAGNYVQLDCFKNGVLMETLMRRVVEANLASKAFEVSGECEFVQSVITDYFQVKIITDDPNGIKTIVGGNCFTERVGA